MIYMPTFLLAALVLLAGCGAAADGPPPAAAGNGLIVVNKTSREIAVLGVNFNGKRELPAVALGAGATKTLMGRIASVRGLPMVHYTYGRVGDASVEVELQHVDYNGGLDRLVLQLGDDERWTLLGENAGSEVFRSAEVSRREIPPERE